MDHYGLELEEKINPARHENGDAEQSHNRFKGRGRAGCFVAAAILSIERLMLGFCVTSAISAMPGAKCDSPRNGR